MFQKPDEIDQILEKERVKTLIRDLKPKPIDDDFPGESITEQIEAALETYSPEMAGPNEC